MAINSTRELFEATTPNALRDNTSALLDEKYNSAHGLLSAGPDEGTQRKVAASMKAILREMDRQERLKDRGEERKKFWVSVVSAVIAGASLVVAVAVKFWDSARIERLERTVARLEHVSQVVPVSSAPPTSVPASQSSQGQEAPSSTPKGPSP
jgi:hypothetical protein